jgi:2-polyprenyl-3-methyl-5-hydroxy-6-metoxy-1,4-benzoquinol methylase
MAHRRHARIPDTIDWQNPESIWYAQPASHGLRPGGDNYGRYLWVKDRIAMGSRVLDIGCGTGQLAENLSLDLGCEVCGVDIVPEFTNHCNVSVARGLVARGVLAGWFVCADFSSMTTDQVRSLGRFDVVTALEVIEHPVDVRGFRRNACLALRPGGKLVITTPHPDSRSVGWHYKNIHPHHIRMWSRWRLEQVFGPVVEYGEIAHIREVEMGGDVSHIGAVFVRPESLSPEAANA